MSYSFGDFYHSLNFIQSPYYIYGISVGDPPSFCFGISDLKPAENKLAIYRSHLTNRERLNIEVPADREPDVFEVEVCSSAEAATAAVEYWAACFRSWGLPLLQINYLNN